MFFCHFKGPIKQTTTARKGRAKISNRQSFFVFLWYASSSYNVGGMRLMSGSDESEVHGQLPAFTVADNMLTHSTIQEPPAAKGEQEVLTSL